MRLLLIFIVLPTLFKAQYWVRIADFPGSKRDDGVAVVLNNKAYFGTGLQEGYTSTIDFYALDLNTRQWEKIPDMPAGSERQYATAFAGNNCFYVFAGDNNGPLNDLYKYDVGTSGWTKMASKPGSGLIGPSCFVFGSKVIVTGGKTSTTGVLNSEVWEYNSSNNTWTQKNNFPFAPRWHSNAAVLQNKGYLLLGQLANDSCGKEFYRYDPATDSWSKLNDFPTSNGRSYAAMQAVSNRLVLFGGVSCYGVHYNDMWYYNTAADAWSQDISLPSFVRRGGMSCSDGTHFYYSCGYSEGNGRLKETWMTDIPTGLNKALVENETEIFPNPFSTELNIRLGANEATLLNIKNSIGELVYEIVLDGSGTHTITTPELKNGIYFLELKNSNTLLVKKLIKI